MFCRLHDFFFSALILPFLYPTDLGHYGRKYKGRALEQIQSPEFESETLSSTESQVRLKPLQHSASSSIDK